MELHDKTASGVSSAAVLPQSLLHTHSLVLALTALVSLLVFWLILPPQPTDPAAEHRLGLNELVTPARMADNIDNIDSVDSVDSIEAAAGMASAVAPETSTVQRTTHQIAAGDTLGKLFEAQAIEHADLARIMEVDSEVLALATLRTGDWLRFERDAQTGQLLQLALQVHPGKTLYYRRSDDTFEFEEDLKPAYWHEEVVSTVVHGSFYASALKAGISEGDVARVQRIFQDRINFRRDLQAGDRVELMLGREMVDVGATGRTRIAAIRLQAGRKDYSAFLHSDGNYYDEQGKSLNRALLRYPSESKYRVSSHFNPRRLHPVTGRISPHNGVDFAMPTGTPVLTTGDGVVTRVGNHPFAGKYIEINHPGQFKTRYLHLSRILVRKGQKITRGQRVALSGNTGRSTGPHLHFELHIDERPVNPLRARIPSAADLAKEEMPAFNRRVSALITAMQGPALIAQADSPATVDDVAQN